ncbi:uncharacterized protein LOC121716004 isoform X1 [Alosa sapidissima]|uniref:uncharacterized protein LOC121716004 isoform X1 n=2 Tax=Alosa sapidissima TaxID=34773 RepID=UPI001C0903B7|nr:uncharacterized protein LOC121716004 isoform X1 [Alosa sapidissima]
MLSFRLLCLLGVLRGTMTRLAEVTNVALGGIATQSGKTWDWGHANNAIDGNRDSNWYHYSCSHTVLEPNPWWRVDLLKKYRVHSVVITNRGDCCPMRLQGARITIGNSPEINGGNQICGNISNPAGQSWTFNCEGMEGRYVHVYIQGRSEYLTLCEVEVYAESNLKNVALDGIATQSGKTWDSGHAIKAIDGNRDSIWNHNSCSHTHLTTDPWWRVDLLRKYRVQSVVITNRKDCCGARLNGAWIVIGNSPEIHHSNQILFSCGNISNPAGQSMTFNCEGMEGRYVHVFIQGRSEYLTLCEVEVYAESYLKNVALDGIATQSGATWDWGHADKAIDGNRDSNWYHYSCSHTGLEPNPWWRVDLLKKYRVHSVVITNRGDCCGERLNGVRIKIGNSPEIHDSYQICDNANAGKSWTFNCDGMEGRYVHVYIQGRSEYLTLCEVEVYTESSGRLAAQFSGASTLSLCACALLAWIAAALLTKSLS